MPVLRRGDSGRAVRELQERLGALGALPRDPPGCFGLHTEAAIYLLQHSEGLEPDGIVGPETMARLRAKPALRCSTHSGVDLLTIIEGVPYFSQRDNRHAPRTTCNVTVLAMLLSYHGVRPRRRGQQLEDELYELLHSPEAMAHYRATNPRLAAKGRPPNEVYENLAWAARYHGIPTSFEPAVSLSAIEAEVRAGRPVILSGLFTGTGHVVLLIGLTASGDLVCHDPWGDWMRGYRSRNGEARIYEGTRARAVLRPLGRTEKWALFTRTT